MYAPELDGALIFDGEHLLSQEHLAISKEIAYRYRNLRLVHIPASARETEAERKYPFAVVDTDTGKVIRKFSEDGPNSVRTALDWLWENDSQRVDTWAKYQNEINRAERERKAKADEEYAEKADLAAFVIGGPLHTVRHNGVKFDDSYRAGMRGLDAG